MFNQQHYIFQTSLLIEIITCASFFSFRVVPVNGKQVKQVCSWLLGAQRGSKNTSFEWHSSAVNICRFTCSFPLQLSIPLLLIRCANRQTASPTLDQNLVFQGHTVCPFIRRSELIWKWTMLQSHSQAFVIATKIFNVPSTYTDKRKAIKSYSLKMSYCKLSCGLGPLVWFGNMIHHLNALVHQLFSLSDIQ